ncbi:MAG TPA: hypothetical protein VIH85_09140 [Solirubrobacteraceae bacterium]
MGVTTKGAAAADDAGGESKTAAQNGVGKPGGRAADDAVDVFTAFASSAATAVKQAELGQPDEKVWVAFALGWQLAELYRPDRRRTTPPVAEDDLPGLGRFTVDEWTHLGLDQVQAGITKLQEAITGAGLDVPDAETFAASVPSITDPAERSEKIREFHVGLLSTLTAADFRLGKAYGLGRALADTTRHPNDFREELKPGRMANLMEWTLDLATAFQPHASHAVAASMDAWSTWSTGTTSGDDAAVLRTLAAQGRTWRSLLSGEKRASSVLETGDYVKAGEGLVERSKSLVGQFLHHYWWLAGLIALLFVGGIAVILIGGNARSLVTGAATILAGLGLTWKGVGATLGTAAARLEEPVWGAELDAVISSRITNLPG